MEDLDVVEAARVVEIRQDSDFGTHKAGGAAPVGLAGCNSKRGRGRGAKLVVRTAKDNRSTCSNCFRNLVMIVVVRCVSVLWVLEGLGGCDALDRNRGEWIPNDETNNGTLHSLEPTTLPYG